MKATGTYDAQAATYTLTLAQSCAPTPGQATKEPFVIPVALGLVGADGHDVPLQPADEPAAVGTSGVFVLTQATQTLTFTNVTSEPVPSILRGFSAPVVLEFDYSNAQLLKLLASDAGRTYLLFDAAAGDLV